MPNSKAWSTKGKRRSIGLLTMTPHCAIWGDASDHDHEMPFAKISFPLIFPTVVGFFCLFLSLSFNGVKL